MATELLGVTAADQTSANFTSGGSTTVFLKNVNGLQENYNGQTTPIVMIDIQTSTGTWCQIGWLTYAEPAKVITAIGTFRVRKKIAAGPVGAEYS